MLISMFYFYQKRVTIPTCRKKKKKIINTLHEFIVNTYAAIPAIPLQLHTAAVHTNFAKEMVRASKTNKKAIIIH